MEALRGCMAVLGCPPDPSNNSGGAWGHPLAPLTNQRDCACGHVHSLTSDHGLAVAVVRVVAARRWRRRGNGGTARRRSDKYAVASPLRRLTPGGRQSGRLEAGREEERHAEWSGG